MIFHLCTKRRGTQGVQLMEGWSLMLLELVMWNCYNSMKERVMEIQVKPV